jgi:hypothetical protein
MNSDIQQLALDSTVSAIEKMIPIFIGTSKTMVSEEPIFTDTTYKTIQLSVDNDHAIDQNSITPYLTYWEQVSARFLMDFVTPTYIVYMPNLNPGIFDKDSIFVLYDNSGKLLFSSKIESFVYDVDVLTSIKLTTLCPLVGNYNFTLINKVKKLVTFDFDNTTNQVWPNYPTFAPIVSFQNIISSESTISYKIYSKIVNLKTYETITPEDISNEQNIAISKGLLSSSAAVVINIPNDTYINSAIELIKTLDYGYYIVPIDLSTNSIKALASYVQFSELDTSYKTLLIPAEQAESKIISSATYMSA